MVAGGGMADGLFRHRASPCPRPTPSPPIRLLSVLLSPRRPGNACPPFPTPFPGLLNDLHSLDPANMTWTKLSAARGSPPAARAGHGFTSAGGKLYVHGGYGNFWALD